MAPTLQGGHVVYMVTAEPAGFPGGSAGKESACNAGDLSSIPGLGRSPGEGKGYLLQYSALENSMHCIVCGLQRVGPEWVVFILVSLPRSSVGKDSAYNAGDLGSIPGSGRSSGEGNGNPLRYFCLENPMDRGTWWATVRGVVRVGHDWVTKHTGWKAIAVIPTSEINILRV